MNDLSSPSRLPDTPPIHQLSPVAAAVPPLTRAYQNRAPTGPVSTGPNFVRVTKLRVQLAAGQLATNNASQVPAGKLHEAAAPDEGGEPQEPALADSSEERPPVRAAEPEQEPGPASGATPGDDNGGTPPPPDTPVPGAPLPEEPNNQNGETTSASPTDREIQTMLRALRQKNYFLGKMLREGALPAVPEAERFLQNPLQIADNGQELAAPDSTVRQALVEYLGSAEPPDLFTIQDQSDVLVSALLKDTGAEPLDMADLVWAVRVVDRLAILMISELPKETLDRNIGRIIEFQRATWLGLVYATSPLHLVGESIRRIADVHEAILAGAEPTPAEQRDLAELQAIINDRAELSTLIVDGGLWTKEDSHGASVYAQPPAPGELERLNEITADTIERLHLLGAYGVAPFEVSGDKVGLPWDIAVIPPLTFPKDGEPRYAEGAVADFMILPKNHPREDMLIRTGEEREDGSIPVSFGEMDIVTRLRLHHDGRITHGTLYHNIPSDYVEKELRMFKSGPAFERLRALLVALAFDAIATDEVVRGDVVGGSVASILGNRPKEPIGSRLGEVILRRQRALVQANVHRNNRKPEGWAGPTKTVDGYTRRLPEGCSRRPTAEADARKWHEARGLAFSGLPEGYNWVGDSHRRTITEEPTYRTARLRGNSATSSFVRGLRNKGRRRR